MKSNNLNVSSQKPNVFSIFLFLIVTHFGFSQVQKISTIIQYDQFVNASKSETKSQKPLRIENLINDIQSSVYVEFDGVKTYGLKPLSVFTSIRNVENINKFSFNYENIEIINIRINTFDDLKSNVDLNIFNKFKKLKYIYIISDIKCNASDIKPIFKNIGNYIVLFKIAGNS